MIEVRRATPGDAGFAARGIQDRRTPALSSVPASEIYSFYGHPDGWGSGVAGALMAGSLRDTPRARRFNAKYGFVETGAVRTGDGNPLPQVEYERPCR